MNMRKIKILIEVNIDNYLLNSLPMVNEVTFSQINRNFAIRSCFFEYFYSNNHFGLILFSRYNLENFSQIKLEEPQKRITHVDYNFFFV